MLYFPRPVVTILDRLSGHVGWRRRGGGQAVRIGRLLVALRRAECTTAEAGADGFKMELSFFAASWMPRLAGRRKRIMYAHRFVRNKERTERYSTIKAEWGTGLGRRCEMRVSHETRRRKKRRGGASVGLVIDGRAVLCRIAGLRYAEGRGGRLGWSSREGWRRRVRQRPSTRLRRAFRQRRCSCER